MRALRVRLVGLGASLVLVLTGIGGVGSALAFHDDNVAVACNNVDVATSGGTNEQSINSAGVATADGTKRHRTWHRTWWPIDIVVVIVDVATSGRTDRQSIHIVQGNSTVARDGTVVSGGTNVRCVAIATRD